MYICADFLVIAAKKTTNFAIHLFSLYFWLNQLFHYMFQMLIIIRWTHMTCTAVGYKLPIWVWLITLYLLMWFRFPNHMKVGTPYQVILPSSTYWGLRVRLSLDKELRICWKFFGVLLMTALAVELTFVSPSPSRNSTYSFLLWMLEIILILLSSICVPGWYAGRLVHGVFLRVLRGI